uniref:Uncharacterized protein n=1 Tax=Romanomermis culicivorax TaxID=13658 RepID=A0A915IAR9_ROMCU
MPFRTDPKIKTKSRIPRPDRQTKLIRPKFNLGNSRKSPLTKKSIDHFCQIAGDNDLLFNDPFKKLSHLRFHAFEELHVSELRDESDNYDRCKNLETSTFWRIFGVRPISAKLKPDTKFDFKDQNLISRIKILI